MTFYSNNDAEVQRLIADVSWLKDRNDRLGIPHTYEKLLTHLRALRELPVTNMSDVRAQVDAIMKTY